MTRRIFREGGPHKIRRTGQHQYSMQVKLPADAVGMTARECTDAACSPGAFKVRDGTGITGDHQEAFCPYCRRAADPNDFATPEQLRYATDIMTDEAIAGVERMMADGLGLGPNRKRRLDCGMLSIEMSMKSEHRPPVRPPWEEQLRRDVICPHCTLEHAVYGLAVWCPDCGADIFVTHIETESQVLRAMLNDVDRRNNELGPRVAARDIENGLEDVVSILEAALKAMMRRRLLAEEKPVHEVDEIMGKKVRNRFQSYDGTLDILERFFDLGLSTALDPDLVDRFRGTLQKRHAITHNLGIVDRKYLQRVRTGEAEGRDVSLDEREVIAALETALAFIRHVHAGLFA